ncbi:hypothetical protein E4U53_007375 [Claviceps sorghi]|nr:hypothetical protein E4U53_007375 [Claviceps sorghi]
MDRASWHGRSAESGTAWTGPTGYYPHPSLSPSSPTVSHEITAGPAPPSTNPYGTPSPDHQPQQHPPAGFQLVPGQQQQQQQQQQHPLTLRPSAPHGPVYEVPDQTSDDHRGQMHEMA